ncbi:MAG: GNAT family N-acetyltransferase [Cohaesibacter sp.]|jgi:CelD/BcsL family acetyltransferase involved in cellulose biosynthesis|nr:GNAT family N-acetyltransferase [Cohaesibacter sp.]
MFDYQISDHFDYLAPDFTDLFERSNASAFQHPQWLTKLQSYMAKHSKAEGITLTIREQATGRLVLVLPMLRRRKGVLRILEFANLGFVDYASSIYDPTRLHFLLQQKDLPKRIAALLPAYDLLWIKHIQTPDLILSHLFGKAERLEAGFSSHRTCFNGSFEDWQQKNMSKKRRGNLRRARKALGEQGSVSTRLLECEEEIETAFKALQAFRHQRFSNQAQNEWIQDPEVCAVYIELAKSGLKDGTARTYQLMVGEDIAAVGFGLCHRNDFVYLLPGADYENYARFSPGLVLLEDMIKSLINDGFCGFDFSIGDEAYKTKFGTRANAIHTLAKAETWLGQCAMAAARLMKNRTDNMSKRELLALALPPKKKAWLDKPAMLQNDALACVADQLRPAADNRLLTRPQYLEVATPLSPQEGKVA